MTVAVLGAGIMGCCVALEMADRGQSVALFDRRSGPMMETSRWSEGKLHLGYVYAKDQSLDTARRMAQGAVRFCEILERWIDVDQLKRSAGTPFYYANHVDSLLDDSALENHLVKVSTYLEQMDAKQRSHYPCLGGVPELRSVDVEEAGFDGGKVTSAYVTSERSIDTFLLADLLSDAVKAHPNIDCRMNARVTAVNLGRRKTVSVSDEDGAIRDEGPFNYIVNALWSNRPVIDEPLGLCPAQKWINRYKLGVNFIGKKPGKETPSVTFAIGPFGDVVRFPTGRTYLSWYPTGLIGMTNTAEYVDWNKKLASVDQARVAEDSLLALQSLMKGLDDLSARTRGDYRVEGGAIYALGESDIDQQHSGLHSRHHEEVLYGDGYASIDTAKLTVAPSRAMTLVSEIFGD